MVFKVSDSILCTGDVVGDSCVSLRDISNRIRHLDDCVDKVGCDMKLCFDKYSQIVHIQEKSNDALCNMKHELDGTCRRCDVMEKNHTEMAPALTDSVTRMTMFEEKIESMLKSFTSSIEARVAKLESKVKMIHDDVIDVRTMYQLQKANTDDESALSSSSSSSSSLSHHVVDGSTVPPRTSGKYSAC